MTNPTFKHNPDTQCLDEVARMEKPKWNPEIWDVRSDFDHAEELYYSHVANLRSVKTEPGSVWPVGELIEGKDFTIEGLCCTYNYKYSSCERQCDNGFRAVAIPLNREEEFETVCVRMSVVNALFDLAEVPVKLRQQINDTADDFLKNNFTINKKP